MNGKKSRNVVFSARTGGPHERPIGRAVASVLAMAGLIGDYGIASAQTAANSSETLEEVVVTGSRIKRQDYESKSPIVTVNSDAFENKSSVAIESTLNQLPQFKPSGSQSALSPAQNPFPSATATQGAETLDLRGLGPNRTLVLIDGRRAQPINASLAIDVNTIPLAAIESVETITGGAASTYGADAIAGVVNFKLKRNFQGIEFDAQYGISQEGDDREPQVSALLGTNFAEGKGNIMLSLSYADRSGIQGRDRGWVRAGWNDPGTVAGAPGANLSNFNPGFANLPTAPAGGWLGPTTSAYSIDQNGHLFDVNKPQSATHPYTGPIGATDLGIFKINRNGSLGFAATDNDQLQIPLTRWSAFGVGRFAFNDHLSTFLELNVSESKTTFTGFHSANDTVVWTLFVPYNHLYDNPASPTFGQANATAAGTTFHPVPTELARLLNSRAAPDSPWQYTGSMDYIQGFTDISTSNVYQFTGGFDGDVPGTPDWTWEVFGSHGRTNNIQEQPEGFPNLTRLQTLFNANLYGQNWSNPATLAVTGHCTSGLPLFNADGSVNNTPSISKDCADWMLLRMNTITQITQDNWEADLTGSLFDMPFSAGKLRFAVGADYRSDNFNFNPDSGFNANQAAPVVLQNIILPVGVQGETHVSEAYVELSIPLLKDVPFVKSLEIDPGYRYSKYNTAGVENTFKLLGDWAVTDWIKFRGGLQVANRAPNIAELFTPAGSSQITGTSGTITPDPCAYFSVTPSWGNVPENANRYNVQALCQYLMIRQGNTGQYMIPGDTGDRYNYTVFGPAAFNGAFPFSIAIIQGNPNLESETARTVTFGTVLRSPFEAALASHLSLSVDWYRINVKNAIGVADYNAVYQQCLDPQFNKLVGDGAGAHTGAELFAGSPSCAFINRETSPLDPYGAGRNYQAPYINQGGIKSSGIDAEIDWSVKPSDMGARLPGTFSLNILGTYVKEYAVQTFGGQPFVDFTGTTVNSSFQYKLFTTLSYSAGRASAGLRWQHLPAIDPTPGSAAIVQGAPSHNQVDLFGHWALTPTIDIRGGVDNLLNAWPETVGAQTGVNNNTGATIQDYDTIGRRYYVGVRARF